MKAARRFGITIPNGLPIFNGQLRPNLVAGVDPFSTGITAPSVR